jgi:anti-sigma regulatory factor (Ser/Thr protein kinase)
MGQLRTALRAYAIEGHKPPDVLELLDRLLQTVRGRGMATAAYAQFDPETGQMSMSSAGHPPPILVPKDGEARVLEIGTSAPLGTLAYPNFSSSSVELRQGDTLLLYTDGLVEVRGEPLDEGIERLRRIATAATTPERLCDRAMRELVPEEGAQDDVAVVALQNSVVADVLHIELPAQPAVLAQARHLLRRWLREKGAGAEDIEAIALASGEACANAIEHAYPPGPATFQVEASAEDGVVTLVVRDAGKWREARGSNRGRGLGIMKAVMDHVEVRQRESGTEVLLKRRIGTES